MNTMNSNNTTMDTVAERQAGEQLAAVLDQGDGQLSDHVRERLMQARLAAVEAASAKVAKRSRPGWFAVAAASACAAVLAVVLLVNPETQAPGAASDQQIAVAPDTTAPNPFATEEVADLLVAEEDLDFLIWLDVQAGES